MADTVDKQPSCLFLRAKVFSFQSRYNLTQKESACKRNHEHQYVDFKKRRFAKFKTEQFTGFNNENDLLFSYKEQLRYYYYYYYYNDHL